MTNRVAVRAALVLAALSAAPASAGPPYATDDPEPTDLGKWEIYGFTAGTRYARSTDGEAGFDVNYGAAPDLQASIVGSIDYERGDGGNHAGLADLELGLKYRLFHAGEGSPLPDVAIFPQIDLPTAGRRFGPGKVSAFLPIWLEKDYGSWSLFGGGGYTINPGAGNRDFALAGLALTRSISPRLSVGGELYHRGADADDGGATTGLGLGGGYQLAPRWSVIASGGPYIEHRDSAGRYAFYVALAFRN